MVGNILWKQILLIQFKKWCHHLNQKMIIESRYNICVTWIVTCLPCQVLFLSGHEPIFTPAPAAQKMLLTSKVVKNDQKSYLIWRIALFIRHCINCTWVWTFQWAWLVWWEERPFWHWEGCTTKWPSPSTTAALRWIEGCPWRSSHLKIKGQKANIVNLFESIFNARFSSKC